MALLGLAGSLAWALSSPPYRGPISDHFDGTTFTNADPTPLPTLGKAVRMFAEREQGPWDDWRELDAHPVPRDRVADGGLRVTFINHATTLIQIDGVNVLTDPIWSDRCSPVQFVGPKRHHPPGVAFDDLPPIDVVLVSHNHYDHLDLDTLRDLAAAHDPLILTGLGNGAFLAQHGLHHVQELDWDDAVPVGDLVFHSQRTRHFSSRGLADRNKTLWTGFVIEAPSGNLYFAGDTGYGAHFAASAQRFGPFRLALLPIGAYAPRWFMGPIHVDPQDAVRAHIDLRSERSVGIHFGTFLLSNEGQDDPPRELAEASAAAGLAPGAFIVLDPGEGLDVPPIVVR